MRRKQCMFALLMGVACTASAQKTGKKKAQKSVKTEQVSNVSSDQEEKLTLTKEVCPQAEEDGDLYHGLTKKLTFDRMNPPHGLEVTYDKTVHILFPPLCATLIWVAPNLIAGKADGAECYPCEGDGKELPHGNEYERHHGGWLLLFLQCEVCRRAADAQCGDEGLHP